MHQYHWETKQATTSYYRYWRRAAKTIAPKLLQEIGCQVETINDELDGCSRGPDPTSNELTELVSKTKDLGFAFDLDSDRVILVMNGEKKIFRYYVRIRSCKSNKIRNKKIRSKYRQ